MSLVYNQSSLRTMSLNNSPTKQSYSFSKNPRFNQLSQSNCSSDYYQNIHYFHGKKGPGFGIGEKTDFSKQNTNVPGPGSYRIASIFSKQKGASFGAGRDEVKCNGIYSRVEAPSPLNYKIPSSLNHQSFSFGAKLNQQISNIPGPGHYNNFNALSPQGKYILSNLQNARAPAFNPPKSDRFIQLNTNSPGPGSYKPKTDLQTGGKFIVSNQPSVLAYSLPKSKRDYYPKETSQETPGPGSYKCYSEFH